MYNSELKERFVKETNKSAKRSDFFQIVFNRLEECERECGTDFCCMSVPQMQAVFNSMSSLKGSTLSLYKSMLSDYSKWCVDQGITGANLNVLEIKEHDCSALRDKMVSSPKQLQKFLDSVFMEERKETADTIYRAYFWLAFSGVPEEKIFELKCSDIERGGKLIFSKFGRYKVPEEGALSLNYCATLRSFLYVNNNYKNGPTRIDRVEGDELLRGIRGKMNSVTSSQVVHRVIKKAIDNGQTTINPSYNDIWLSGRFYSIYNEELLGLEPDFYEMAVEHLRTKDCKGSRSRSDRIRMAENRYEKEYYRWKSAFNL